MLFAHKWALSLAQGSFQLVHGCFQPSIQPWVERLTRSFVKLGIRSCLQIAFTGLCCAIVGFVLAMSADLSSARTAKVPAQHQDNGSAVTEFRGNGAEITVIVKDPSGEPISSPAMVKVLRDGTIPSGQGPTSRGHAIFVVNLLGEYTVDVAVPGYAEVRKDVSLQSSGRYQVDVLVRPLQLAGTATGVPGRPVLAPKAQEAVEKGLQALSADNLNAAARYVGKAAELAPGHPDVLYLEGVLNLRQRNWAQAQSSLEKATQIDPHHALAFSALGMALCDQGKYDVAIAPLKKSLELNAGADAWETRWTLARALYRHEEYDAALKVSNDALAGSNGRAPEIELLVAQSLTAVGRYEDAAETLRDFVKQHGDHREAKTARRWLEQLAGSGKIHAN